MDRSFSQKYDGLVNRDAEIEKLLHTIEKEVAEVDILYSRSGIGKSSLVKKLIFQLSEENIPNVILIKTLSHNVCSASREWLYIDFIFDAFNKHFEASGAWSFQSFLSSGRSDIINKQMYEHRMNRACNISSIKKFFLDSVLSFAAKAQNLYAYNPYKISADNSMRARIIKAQYIEFILLTQRIIFMIDNVQNIDSTSFKFFLDWVNEAKGKKHYFLLQYTVTETTDLTALSELYEQISDTGICVKTIELANMPSNYVADIIENQITDKPTSIRFNLDALQHYETRSNGNLRELLDYVRRYKIIHGETQRHREFNSTVELMLALTPEAKSILAILVFSGGEVPKDVLTTIWNEYFDGGEISPILQELKSSRIIDDKTKPKNIVIDHASIITEWDSHIELFNGIDRMVYNRLELICVRILQDFTEPEDKKIANYEAWQYLLHMYAKREPSKIMNLLEDLEAGLVSNLSAKNVWHYIKLLIQHTESELDKYKAVYYKLLSILYKLELFHEGMECLKKMEQKLPLTKNHLLILYKINFLTGLDQFNEAIALYQWASGFITEDDSIWYHLQLCILCSYRSINDIQQCKKIGKQVKTLKNWREKPEYAYYLRLMNIYLPNSAAIRHAYQSAKWFKLHGDSYQAGKSYITYSKLLASVGSYRKAIKVSQVAQKLLNQKMETSHFLCSNLAAYKLLRGERGIDIWQLLCQAELSASVPYSYLAIIVNKLAWCYENKDFNKIDFITNSAKKLLTMEPDEHIHALYYYNMHLISNIRHDEFMSKYYFKKAYELQDKCRFIAARISGVDKHRREIRCRLKRPWHVCFLSFWTYDLPTDDTWIESS